MLTSTRALMATPSILALLLTSACGGGGGASGTDGSGGSSTSDNTGGSGNGSSTSSNNTGGSTTSSSSMGTGGSAACHPSVNDINAMQCSNGCECADTETSNDTWCNDMLNQGLQACPDDGNKCWAGMNNCGYDLPMGETYVAPSCTDKVNGSTWMDEFSNEGSVNQDFDSNGQLQISIDLIGSEESYFQGTYRLSGKKIYWNRANATTLESAEGDISDDCATITVRFYNAGEGSPYKTRSIFWSHD